VKNNKEDSIALSKHASEITIQLFAALQTMNDLDSIRPNIEAFIKYAYYTSCFVLRDSALFRVLEGIVDFSKERAERNGYQRIVKKQGDAEDIKKWEKELARAYERFNVRSELPVELPLSNEMERRSTPCWISTLEPLTCRLERKRSLNTVRKHRPRSFYVSHSFCAKSCSTSFDQSELLSTITLRLHQRVSRARVWSSWPISPPG
jgi:hypothetical protein